MLRCRLSSGTAGGSGQYKPGEAPKAQNAAAQLRLNPPPCQPNPHRQQRNPQQPNRLHQVPLRHAVQRATAQSAPAQDASTEAKSSPFHAIGEFFERRSAPQQWREFQRRFRRFQLGRSRRRFASLLPAWCGLCAAITFSAISAARNRSAKIPSSSFRAPASSTSIRSRSSAFPRTAPAP